MRPRRNIEKHNLNIRKNVYGRPRKTVKHYRIKDFNVSQNVSNELINTMGIEAVKREIAKELLNKLLDSNMIDFTEIVEDHNIYSNTRTITAKLKTVQNG